MSTVCPGCGWDLAVLGPPMGRTTIPDLGGYCGDCVPCTQCGIAVDQCRCPIPFEWPVPIGPEPCRYWFRGWDPVTRETVTILADTEDEARALLDEAVREGELLAIGRIMQGVR